MVIQFAKLIERLTLHNGISLRQPVFVSEALEMSAAFATPQVPNALREWANTVQSPPQAPRTFRLQFASDLAYA